LLITNASGLLISCATPRRQLADAGHFFGVDERSLRLPQFPRALRRSPLVRGGHPRIEAGVLERGGQAVGHRVEKAKFVVVEGVRRFDGQPDAGPGIRPQHPVDQRPAHARRPVHGQVLERDLLRMEVRPEGALRQVQQRIEPLAVDLHGVDAETQELRTVLLGEDHDV
jgi:hypothetical protein